MGLWNKMQPRTKADPTPLFIAIPDKELGALAIEQGCVMVDGARYALLQRDGLLKVTAAQRTDAA